MFYVASNKKKIKTSEWNQKESERREIFIKRSWSLKNPSLHVSVTFCLFFIINSVLAPAEGDTSVLFQFPAVWEFCLLDAKLLPLESDNFQFATFYHHQTHSIKTKDATEKQDLGNYKEHIWFRQFVFI